MSNTPKKLGLVSYEIQAFDPSTTHDRTAIWTRVQKEKSA